MTAAEYHAKVSTFDADRIQALIDQIPKNINPTGRLFRKLTKEIYETANKKVSQLATKKL